MDKNNEYNQDDDDFGLPDMGYNDENPSYDEEKKENPVKSKGYVDDSNNNYLESRKPQKSNFPVVAVVVGLLLVATVGFTYFLFLKPRAEKAKKEELARKKQQIERRKKQEEAKIAQDIKEQAMVDSLALVKQQNRVDSSSSYSGEVKPVEILTEKVSRYHVVVSSGIDDDLIMDYARSLSRKGVEASIIPPYGSGKFYRLTISGNGLESATEAGDMLKNVQESYGGNAWILRY